MAKLYIRLSKKKRCFEGIGIILCKILCAFILFIFFKGIDFEIIPSKFEENLDKSSFKLPSDYVMKTAYFKTLDVVKSELGVCKLD